MVIIESFLLCGLKYFIALYQAYGTLLAHYFKREENKNRDRIFGKDSSLNHFQDSNCFDVIGGEKWFNSELCISTNFDPSNVVTALAAKNYSSDWLRQTSNQKKSDSRFMNQGNSLPRSVDISSSKPRYGEVPSL